MAAKKPTHYAILLKRSWTSEDGVHTIPAGPHIVAAEVVDLIPAELVSEKTPAEA